MTRIFGIRNILAIAVLCSFLIPSVTFGYSYLGTKWAGTTAAVQITYWPTGWVGPLAYAMASWNNVSPSHWYFTSGNRGNYFVAGYYDPVIYPWPAFTSPVTNPITQVNTWFNTAYPWSTNGSPNALDVQDVATHELGHWLRLQDLYESGDTEKTMYGYTNYGVTKRRTLESDDKNGINYIYP